MSIILKTWDATGQYGPDELNRIEEITRALADDLTAAGYPAVLEAVVADRDITGYEFSTSLSRVEQNIDALRMAFLQPPGWIAVKAWTAGSPHNWQDANRLETDLRLIYEWLVRVIASFKWCGTFACGGDGGIY